MPAVLHEPAPSALDVFDRRGRSRAAGDRHRGTVQVPGRRRGRAVGGERRGRDRDAGLGEHGVRPAGARAAAKRGAARPDRADADRARRERGRPPVRNRRGVRPQRELHRRALHRVGRRHRRRRVRGAGQLPRGAAWSTPWRRRSAPARHARRPLVAALAAGQREAATSAASRARRWWCSSPAAATAASTTATWTCASTTTQRRSTSSRGCSSCTSCTTSPPHRKTCSRSTTRSAARSSRSWCAPARYRPGAAAYDDAARAALVAFMHVENLENRVRDDRTIDRQTLDYLRKHATSHEHTMSP